MYTVNTKIKNQLSIWLISCFGLYHYDIVGGLTRLTDSGLSITKWELFSGFLPPLNQNDG
jgi:cytochrome c oxidase assembly protein subunit 15